MTTLWLMLLMLSLLLFLPMRVQADLYRGTQRWLRITLRIAGFSLTRLIEWRHTPLGRILSISGRDGARRQLRPDARRQQRLAALFRQLRRTPYARRFLLRHTEPLQLDMQWQLHTPSAAATALATGGVQTLLAGLPARWLQIARIRILPDFLSDRSTLQARCIFRLHPGTMLVTVGLLLAQTAAQTINREAHRIWNTPSEN